MNTILQTKKIVSKAMIVASGLLLVAACRPHGQIGKADLNAGEAMHLFDAACVEKQDLNKLGMVYNREQKAWFHKSQLASVKIHNDKMCTMAFGSKDDPNILEFMLRGKGADEFDVDGGSFGDQTLYIAANLN